MEKIRLNIPVVVEGRYDKARMSGIIDGTIITTEGFGIFKNEEKKSLIRRLGRNGLILLCDSDGGGRTIRSHLKGCLGGITVYDLYIPQVKGKEKRKAEPSKEGFLGVEGTENETLRGIISAFLEKHPELTGGEAKESEPVTPALLFELGLNGTPDASAKREQLCRMMGFPADMNVKSLTAALNMVSDADEVRGMACIIRDKKCTVSE